LSFELEIGRTNTGRGTVLRFDIGLRKERGGGRKERGIMTEQSNCSDEVSNNG
jgi:hypothetical protein